MDGKVKKSKNGCDCSLKVLLPSPKVGCLAVMFRTKARKSPAMSFQSLAIELESLEIGAESPDIKHESLAIRISSIIS
jgi:hypothetical protein